MAPGTDPRGGDPDRRADDVRVVADTAARRTAALIATVTAAMLHTVVGYFYAVSGLVVPGWALLPLWAVWVALAVQVWRLRHRPAHVLAVPVVAAAIWFAVVWLGDVLLGWQA